MVSKVYESICISKLCLSSITEKQSALSGAGGDLRLTLKLSIDE